MPRRSAAAKAQPLPFPDEHETPEQREWLAQQFEALTSEVKVLSPSQWAEQNRYLPASVTPMPGLYDFAVTPFLREIVDCMDLESPIREVTFMKGAQVCATTGVLENTIGYFIAQVQTEAVMLLTSDANLAKVRMDQFITPMIQHSGLEHLIKSSDEKNPRKTGKTEKKLEWFGGGYLLPFGAVNANNLRSVPMRGLLRDEVDSYTNSAKQGDPMKLSESRTAAFEGSRKTLNISTPLFKGTSRIHEKFLQGDQRIYLVRCLKCSFPQELRFHYDNPKTGLVSGLSWELENDNLIPDSVRWLCAECGYAHINEDKQRLLAPENGALWSPKAVASNKSHRSYHLNALYSPVGMQTFEACVRQYLEAWDVARNRMKDAAKLQVFYNNILGLPFEIRGDRVPPQAVATHKREGVYSFGQIPNRFCEQFCGSAVLVLTCTVDVHKDNLAVAVFGWCRDRRAVLIEYSRFEGDTEQLDDKNTWVKLRELIEETSYTADNGWKYKIQLTLIDSGYRTDQVYRFCGDYDDSVYPVKGRATPAKSATLREFSEFTTPNGVRAFAVTVDFYKDRWAASLRREWDGLTLQPIGHFNAPQDITPAQLKELTVEVKRPRPENHNGQDAGFEWHRTPGAANELWDVLVYANLALDLLAYSLCRDQLQLEFVSWPTFYDICEEQEFFSKD